MKNSEKPIENKATAKEGKNKVVSPSADAAADLKDFLLTILKIFTGQKTPLLVLCQKWLRTPPPAILQVLFWNI